MIWFRRVGVILILAWLTACGSPVPPAERSLVELGSADGCDAAVQSCTLAHDMVTLRLELEKNLRAMQPFPLQLQVTGVEPPIEAVNVEFFMEGMDMGLNRYRLLPHEKGWQGQITLPVCLTGTGDWRAVVEVMAKERRYTGTFRFHSSK